MDQQDTLSPASVVNLEHGTQLHGKNRTRKLSPLVRFANYVIEETTFFRAHLAAFTFIPLIFSGIFYASNGRFRVSFLDSMFLCYSAMTVTGLSTVNLSTLTTWQQVILYFLMTIVCRLGVCVPGRCGRSDECTGRYNCGFMDHGAYQEVSGRLFHEKNRD